MYMYMYVAFLAFEHKLDMFIGVPYTVERLHNSSQSEFYQN